MKILIDTHILVSREYDRIIDRHLQDVIRHINNLKYQLVVHKSSIDEVKNDKNILNKTALLSKIEIYPVLVPSSNPNDDQDFMSVIEKPKNPREQVDSYLLYCIYTNEADFFLTEDPEILEKASWLRISGKVMNMKDAAIFFTKAIDESKTKDNGVPKLYFYKKGEKWIMGKEGHKITVDQRRGFDFIHVLLSHENQDIPSSIVSHGGQVSGDTTPHEEASERERADLNLHAETAYLSKIVSKDPNTLLPKIESKLKELRAQIYSDQSLSAEEMIIKHEELNQYERDYKKQISNKPELDTKSSSALARSNISKRVKEALTEIHKNKDLAIIARYLNNHTIKKGITCKYQPLLSDKCTWLLFDPESDNQ